MNTGKEARNCNFANETPLLNAETVLRLLLLKKKKQNLFCIFIHKKNKLQIALRKNVYFEKPMRRYISFWEADLISVGINKMICYP